jgi:hypothetical protein
MVKNMFLLFFLITSVNICAQQGKGIKEISIYESPLEQDNLKNSLRSKIRSIRMQGKADYYLDLNVGNIYCTIAYEDLENLISGIQRLENKSTLDAKNQEDGVKSIVMTPSGFVIGYYINNGKVKRFFGFGHEYSDGVDVNEEDVNEEDINREFSTYEKDFDSFNSEKATYGTYKSRLDDFDTAIKSLRTVKKRIEEIKESEGELTI